MGGSYRLCPEADIYDMTGDVKQAIGSKTTLIPIQMGSPTTHVQTGSSPTLLLHRNQDILFPVGATCALYTKVVESGEPNVNMIFPWTDHAFDALLPQTNLASQTTLYDVDRFLVLLLNKD